MKSLPKNKNIVIVSSYKDSSIVAIEKDEYDKACLDLLIYTNYFEELNENPNTSFKERFTKPTP